MNKSKITFIIGGQASGKSTVVSALRESLKYTTSMDLSAVQDKTNVGERQMYRMHSNILDMFEKSKYTTMNWLVCRSFICEKIYCNLGFKKYSFETYYRFLVEQLEYLAKDYDVNIILLTVNEEQLKERLNRNKFEYNPFSVENSMKQQEQYQLEIRKIAKRDNNIKVFEIENDNLDKTIETIKELILSGMIGE